MTSHVTDQTIQAAIAEAKGALLSSSCSDEYKNALSNIQLIHKINRRLKTVGGRAILRKGSKVYVVEVNPKVHANGTVADLKNTVQHEIAHCIQYHLRGWSDHGSEWKNIHTSLGGNGARCHRIPLKGVAGRDWLYVNLKEGKRFWITTKKAMTALRAPHIIIAHKSDPCVSAWESVTF